MRNWASTIRAGAGLRNEARCLRHGRCAWLPALPLTEKWGTALWVSQGWRQAAAAATFETRGLLACSFKRDCDQSTGCDCRLQGVGTLSQCLEDVPILASRTVWRNGTKVQTDMMTMFRSAETLLATSPSSQGRPQGRNLRECGHCCLWTQSCFTVQGSFT